MLATIEHNSIERFVYQNHLPHYTWRSSNLYLYPESKDHLYKIHLTLEKLTHDSFNSNNVPFTETDLKVAINISTDYSLLYENETGEICGFAFYYLPSEKLDGQPFSYVNKIAITTSTQGHGCGRDFIKTLKDRGIKYFGARTQNPAILKLIIEGAKLNLPYRDKCKAAIAFDFMKIHIPQVRESFNAGNYFDPETGIFPYLYKHRLGNIKLLYTASEIDDLLKSIGFNRDHGDSILMTNFLTTNFF
jgi:hypothetical protein